ncbi:MAG: SulP family inorganic anion transporter [Alphaproteobacteria bacterium]
MNGLVTRLFPVLAWGRAYSADDLPGDMMAGLITAIMLVPQSMAYAMLAGLPPHIGLYASIAPLILYGIFGSSRALAVGPVAIVSLMTATTLATIAPAGSPEYVAAALVLALLNGLVLVILGIARAGFLTNFLSHPVISGFTSAAAIVIGLSQIKHLFGLDMPRGSVVETLTNLAQNLGDTNGWAFGIGVSSILLIVFMRDHLGKWLAKTKLQTFAIQLTTRSGPLVVVAGGALITAELALNESAGLAIVGSIPAGLPELSAPSLDWGLWITLLPSAALIAFVGYLESVSVAKALASKRRQKIDADQELVGLGAANIGAAFTGGYPVTGGFSRSMVNFSAGANTPLASILTAALVAASVVLFAPMFHFLPRTVLAAIILVAVSTLVDFKSPLRAWKYNKADGLAQWMTIIVVLLGGIEAGILTGIGLSLALYLWRTSRPHFAIVGQVGHSEQYRNVKRHKVRIDPEILLFRIDENLYFANAGYLEDHLIKEVAENPDVSAVVLICSAVNLIDASALETLADLRENLKHAGVTLHLAEVKGPVKDRLTRSTFVEELAPGEIFSSTHDAVKKLRTELKADAWYPDI